MLSAKQAREIKETAMPTASESKKVEDAIKSAAPVQNSVFYYEPLSHAMEKKLRENGYKVETLPDLKNEGITIRISWEDTSANDYYNK